MSKDTVDCGVKVTHTKGASAKHLKHATNYAIPLNAIPTKIRNPFPMDFRLARCKLPDDDCSGLARRKEVRTLQYTAPARQPKLMSLR